MLVVVVEEDGSRRLKSQLNSIRESIVKFERELNSGAEKKQKANEQKFQALHRQLEQVNTLMDHEAARVEDELIETESNTQQVLELIWQSLVRFFNHRTEATAKPFDFFKHKCEVVMHRLEKLEHLRENNPLMSEMGSLATAVDDLKDHMRDFVREQEKLEREVLQRIVHLQGMADQQINYWALVLNDNMQELRSMMTDGMQDSAELPNPDFEPVEFILCARRSIASGIVLSDDIFHRYMTLEIQNLNNEMDQAISDRVSADDDIVQAVQRYTQTLQKSLEAAEILKDFADRVAQEK